MSDLIKREDVIALIKPMVGEFTDNGFMVDYERVLSILEDIPSAQPKQGEWIVYEGGWKDLDYYPPKCKCNQCGYEEELYILNAKPTTYCPNCGAHMREREGE